MSDPIDRIRAIDPAGQTDEAMIGRARAELLQRIGEPAAAPPPSERPRSTQPDGRSIDGPDRPHRRSRLVLAGALTSVAVLAVGVGLWWVGLDTDGVQEVESAGVDSDEVPEVEPAGEPPTPPAEPGPSAPVDRSPTRPSTTTASTPSTVRDTGAPGDPPVLEADPGRPTSGPIAPDRPTGPDPDVDVDVDPGPGPGPDTGRTTPPPGDAAPGPGFSEQFDGDTGLDRFRIGVYHRNLGAQEVGGEPEVWGDGNALHGGVWTGDHDGDCGPPDTQRELRSDWSNGRAEFNVDQLVFACRDHVMTSMGDVDGYSIVWFSPRTEFSRATVRTVAWDVNVTDLGGRQWWEVSIVPAGTEFLATVDWLAGTANIGTYHPDAIVVGNGPFGGDVSIVVDGEDRSDRWASVCGLDPEGCDSKMIRRRFAVTDNRDGTITVDYGGLFTQTLAGALPERFEVYFKDHNYTPDKDEVPVGHTWHWDNLFIG